jgi:hypothetical protein
MSKATPATTFRHAPSRHTGSKQGRTVPASPQARTPARAMSTQDLIARIWRTLEWRKTLQVTFIITVTGITVALVLAGLGLLTHAMTSQGAAWPVGAGIITGTASYLTARRRRR